MLDHSTWKNNDFFKEWVNKWKRRSVNALSNRQYCACWWVIFRSLLPGSTYQGFLFRLLDWLCSHCKRTTPEFGWKRARPASQGDLNSWLVLFRISAQLLCLQMSEPNGKRPQLILVWKHPLCFCFIFPPCLVYLVYFLPCWLRPFSSWICWPSLLAHLSSTLGGVSSVNSTWLFLSCVLEPTFWPWVIHNIYTI